MCSIIENPVAPSSVIFNAIVQVIHAGIANGGADSPLTDEETAIVQRVTRQIDIGRFNLTAENLS